MNNLKLFYIFLLIAFASNLSYTQVAFGKNTVDGAGILDFGTGKGMILPWVESAGVSDADGTLIFDTSDNKVKIRQNGVWVDFSVNSGTLDANRANAIAVHLLETETPGFVAIGTTTPSANGVLVLESSDRAFILPKMASPHLNMVDPEPGTIVYDTVSKLMCVFNGSEWTFWGE